MVVNVFITRRSGLLQNKMLVLSVAPSVLLPKAYQTGWIHFGTFDSSDNMFTGAQLEFHIREKGYAVLDAKIQDQQQLPHN